MKYLAFALLTIAFAADMHTSGAQEPATPSTIPSQEIKVETVLEGLLNPTSVAIQPETEHIFVADSGNLRIIRVVDGQAKDVIIEFSKDSIGENPKYEIGPLSLAFIDKETLIVGDGGQADGEELLRVFKVPEVAAEPIKASDSPASFKLAAQENVVGEGNFFAIATTTGGVFVCTNGDDSKGWIARADRQEKTLANFRRFIATKELGTVGIPTALTVSPEGFLAVGQIGSTEQAGDSELAFYDEGGAFQAKFATGLNDITALAYAPKTGRLFAADFSWREPAKSGLYQLTESPDQKGCVAKETMKLDKPASMTFDSKGTLYVVVFGTPDPASDAKPGKLLKITGLDEPKTTKKKN